MGSKMTQPKNHSRVSGAAWDFPGAQGPQRAGGGTAAHAAGATAFGVVCHTAVRKRNSKRHPDP